MKWTRLRSMVEGRFAPSLRGAVTIHQARYRHANEEVGRIWIAVDGKEIVSFATGDQLQSVATETDRRMEEEGAWGDSLRYYALRAEVEEDIRRSGVASDDQALDDLEQSLSLSAAAMLDSPHPLIRALAVLDARIGKRTLTKLKQSEDENPLVRSLLAVRCRAEGIDGENQ